MTFETSPRIEYFCHMSSPPSRSKASILLRMAAAALAFVFLLFALLLRPVDYTPYFETDYYRNTRARLDSLAQTKTARTHGALFVGMGRASITPQLNSKDEKLGHFEKLPMAGYGRRLGRPAEGVHDSLFASAMALRVGEKEVVLVTLDALIVSRTMAEGVLAQVERLGFKREHVLFGATHTHSGPGAWGEGLLAELFAGEYDPRALEWLIAQTVAAIERAHADLSPASFAHGNFAASRYVANRLVGEKGGVDDQFSYLVFRQADGDEAVLGAFAAHATVVSSRNMLFTADYCGYWRNAIERQHRGLAGFFAGGVGSHSPQGEGEAFEAARFIGKGLADSLLSRLPRLVFKSEATLGALGLKIDLPELHMRATDEWRIAPWLAKQLVYERDTYLQLLALDDLLWLGAPCDISGEISSTLKDFAQRRGYQALLTSFNGSYVGYVIPSRYYHYDSYESRRMSFFGPYMGDYLEEMMRRMMVAMMESQ